jgi:hypothetical protein
VNNGPLCYGNVIDVTHSYKELAVPWVRIHDPNWPHPLEVDIHAKEKRLPLLSCGTLFFVSMPILYHIMDGENRLYFCQRIG